MRSEKNRRPQAQERAAHVLVCAVSDPWLVLGALGLSLAAYVGLALILMPPPIATPPMADMFIPELRQALLPEPQEKFLYVFGLLCVPTLPILFYWALGWCSRRLGTKLDWLESRPLLWIRDAGLLAGLIVWLFLLATGSEIPHIYRVLGAAIAVTPMLAFLLRRKWQWHRYVGYAVAALLLLFLSRLQIIGEDRWLSSLELGPHFDLPLGAINQTIHGRTALVDMTSQYGVLYPYVAALVLSPFQLTVQGVTLFFTFVTLLSLLFTYLAVARKIGGGSLATPLIFLSIIGLSYPYFCAGFFDFSVSCPIAYYQGYPLRVVCGAFFIWFVSVYFARKNWWLLLAGYAAAGLSVLWNADTGVVVLIAWTGTNLFDALATHLPNWRKTARALLLHCLLACLAVAASAGAYNLFAWLRCGQWPKFEAYSQYQRIFYVSGYFMLPMNPCEFWQPVVLIHLVTIFRCMRRLLQRNADATTRWYWFIALYGLGIFSYYQGRSHVCCLTAVLYPAIMLAAFLAVDILRDGQNAGSLRQFRGQSSRYAFAAALGCLLFPAAGLFSFCQTLPEAVEFAAGGRPCLPMMGNLEPLIQGLRQRIGNSPAVFFSPIANYLHVKTGSYSALPFASPQEIMLLDQVRQTQTVLDESKDLKYVLIDQRDQPFLLHLRFDKYHVAEAFGRQFVLLQRNRVSPGRDLDPDPRAAPTERTCKGYASERKRVAPNLRSLADVQS